MIAVLVSVAGRDEYLSTKLVELDVSDANFHVIERDGSHIEKFLRHFQDWNELIPYVHELYYRIMIENKKGTWTADGNHEIAYDARVYIYNDYME